LHESRKFNWSFQTQTDMMQRNYARSRSPKRAQGKTMDQYQQSLHVLQDGEVEGYGRSFQGTPLLCFSFAVKSSGGEHDGTHHLPSDKKKSLQTFYHAILEADKKQLKRFLEVSYDFEVGVLGKFRGLAFQYILESLAELLPRRPDLAPRFFMDVVPFHLGDALRCEQAINGLTKCLSAIFELQGAAEVVQTKDAIGALFEIASGMSFAGSGDALRKQIASEARILMAKIVENQNNALGKFLIGLKDGNALRNIGRDPELCSRAVHPDVSDVDPKLINYFSQADGLQQMALPSRHR